jgi:SAM-dependent methyltransferase
MDWYDFWQEYRICNISTEQDLLYQVGKTVAREVISPEQFESLVDSIRATLSLSETDVFLDLCCGNGVLTKRLSPFVAHTHAVDFSAPYIANARQFCAAPNITYHVGDVTKIKSLALGEAPPQITKALIYDALSCFDRASLGRLLGDVAQLCPNVRQVLLGSVFFRPLKWRFFNTASRKLRYLVVMRLMGRNHGIGTWWSPADLHRAAQEGGFTQVVIRRQPPILHTAHYRVDVLLQK